mgnify:CR=1 FL=1
MQDMKGPSASVGEQTPADAVRFHDGRVVLYGGDCLDILDTLPDNSIDAVVTDPPYELGFMGKSWDASGIAFCPQTWATVMRVLKPGGHMVAFGAPKNYHRLACAIEDAGFELRDSLMWVFGTGFPKSLDVSKAIDKAAGAEREIVGVGKRHGGGNDIRGGSFHAASDTGPDLHGSGFITAPATEAAREWQGWGTALKPAYEPIVLARKPLSEKTVAANVLRWGTGALNIDATRIQSGDLPSACKGTGWAAQDKKNAEQGYRPASYYAEQDGVEYSPNSLGRWPANLAHDGSEEVLSGFPNDAGRFFYSAKASKADRAGSKHPTVKPVKLMQWLVRMITPPGGTVLDPFAGSGTTGHAALLEGFNAVLIEREAEYRADITRRIELALSGDVEKKSAITKKENTSDLPLFGDKP